MSARAGVPPGKRTGPPGQGAGSNGYQAGGAGTLRLAPATPFRVTVRILIDLRDVPAMDVQGTRRQLHRRLAGAPPGATVILVVDEPDQMRAYEVARWLGDEYHVGTVEIHATDAWTAQSWFEDLQGIDPDLTTDLARMHHDLGRIPRRTRRAFAT